MARTHDIVAPWVEHDRVALAHTPAKWAPSHWRESNRSNGRGVSAVDRSRYRAGVALALSVRSSTLLFANRPRPRFRRRVRLGAGGRWRRLDRWHVGQAHRTDGRMERRSKRPQPWPTHPIGRRLQALEGRSRAVTGPGPSSSFPSRAYCDSAPGNSEQDRPRMGRSNFPG